MSKKTITTSDNINKLKGRVANLENELRQHKRDNSYKRLRAENLALRFRIKELEEQVTDLYEKMFEKIS